MNYLKNIAFVALLLFFASVQPLMAENNKTENDASKLNVKELILEHLADAYEWHITSTPGGEHVSVPLPVIVKGENTGWNVFMSSKFHHGTEAYNGFYIAKEGPYINKIVEIDSTGKESRVLDFSITKNVFALLLNSAILIAIIMGVANWYSKRKKQGVHEAPGGFVGFMEMFILSIYDDMIKPCVGKNYKKFAPYLLTVFFFIFINNVLGLIPIFPFGANVTGNIAVTFVLAIITFIIVNVFGTKEYWREIFWPDVPMWLKIPPIMPVIEFVGVFTKPFALMIRLFANIFAGHSIVLGLTCLIFVTAGSGVVMSTSMTLVSVVMTVFINIVELLVAYIQAYVFTMLSAVFIGLAQVEPHHQTEKH